MSDLIDTAYIADRLGYEREYVTDRVVKREDFPAPAFKLNRKAVKWRLADFEAWLEAQANRAAGRSAKPSRGSTRAKEGSHRDARKSLPA
jgi:predicted DNA-binding transcriptional regulator AlpA